MRLTLIDSKMISLDLLIWSLVFKMNKIVIAFLFLSFFQSFSQLEKIEKPVVDSLYREDQFYLNITNNSVQNSPSGFNQNRFSPGIGVGFLRDMPINKRRNFAIALGFGYSVSILNQNIGIAEGNSNLEYSIIANSSYDKNKLSIHYIDIPLEIRWRTSDPTNTQFWRIYTGFKFSYSIYNQYKLETSSQVLSLTNIPEINKIQFGCYLTAGWNTFNIYVLYGLNPIFKSAAIGDTIIKANTLNFGLQFYIL